MAFCEVLRVEPEADRPHIANITVAEIATGREQAFLLNLNERPLKPGDRLELATAGWGSAPA